MGLGFSAGVQVSRRKIYSHTNVYPSPRALLGRCPGVQVFRRKIYSCVFKGHTRMILTKLKSEHRSRGRAKYGAALESIWKRYREDAKIRFRQPSVKIHLDQVHRLVASVMCEPAETQKETIAGARKLSILPVDPASVRESVLFIGTRFSNLYTAVDSSRRTTPFTRNEALLALKKRGLAAYTRSLACITEFGLELA